MRKSHIAIFVGLLAVIVFLTASESNSQINPALESKSDSSESIPARKSRTGRLAWGLYEIYWGPGRYARLLERNLSKLASSPDYLMFYRDLGRPFPKSAIETIRKRGAVPIISLELWQWGVHGGEYLKRINAGEFDDYFRQWAVDAAKDDKPVLLRFGFEFNGDWFSWGNKPLAFVAAWKRAWRIFDGQGADNVEWVWAPNVVSVPDTPEFNMHVFYPGDDLVDWVGVDGYNWGENHDQWHHWETCEEIFEAVIRDFESRYPEKPLMIAEFGSVDDEAGRKADWIRDAHRWLLSKPSIRSIIWFNFDKRREGEHDWRVDSSPQTLKAFNETFASPR